MVDGSYPRPVESVREMLILRSTLRGKMLLDSADFRLSPRLVLISTNGA